MGGEGVGGGETPSIMAPSQPCFVSPTSIISKSRQIPRREYQIWIHCLFFFFTFFPTIQNGGDRWRWSIVSPQMASMNGCGMELVLMSNNWCNIEA